LTECRIDRLSAPTVEPAVASSPSLADHTTLRVGGAARRFEVARTERDLIDVVTDCDERGEPLLVLGGGSNLLIADDGFPGTVVRVALTGLDADVSTCGGAVVRVAAGEDWDDVVAYAVEQEWSGLETLSGIPGSVGATPIQNVGAYGAEVADTISRVRLLDRTTGTDGDGRMVHVAIARFDRHGRRPRRAVAFGDDEVALRRQVGDRGPELAPGQHGLPAGGHGERVAVQGLRARRQLEAGRPGDRAVALPRAARRPHRMRLAGLAVGVGVAPSHDGVARCIDSDLRHHGIADARADELRHAPAAAAESTAEHRVPPFDPLRPHGDGIARGVHCQLRARIDRHRACAQQGRG